MASQNYDSDDSAPTPMPPPHHFATKASPSRLYTMGVEGVHASALVKMERYAVTEIGDATNAVGFLSAKVDKLSRKIKGVAKAMAVDVYDWRRRAEKAEARIVKLHDKVKRLTRIKHEFDEIVRKRDEQSMRRRQGQLEKSKPKTKQQARPKDVGRRAALEEDDIEDDSE